MVRVAETWCRYQSRSALPSTRANFSAPSFCKKWTRSWAARRIAYRSGARFKGLSQRLPFLILALVHDHARQAQELVARSRCCSESETAPGLIQKTRGHLAGLERRILMTFSETEDVRLTPRPRNSAGRDPYVATLAGSVARDEVILTVTSRKMDGLRRRMRSPPPKYAESARRTIV